MRVAVVLAFGLGGADRDHLRGVVPLVDRGRDVEPLVALQADQPAAERRRQHLGDLGLADAGLAFEEDRPAHLQRQEQHGRQRPVGEIVGRRQQLERVVDGGRERRGGLSASCRHLLRHGRVCRRHPVARPGMPRMARPGTPGDECPARRPGIMHACSAPEMAVARPRPLRRRQRPRAPSRRSGGRGSRRCRGCRC